MSSTRSTRLRKKKRAVSPSTPLTLSTTVTLIKTIAMEDGLRFAIREGGRTVGAGVVAKIIE
ncbi:EF-Tu C-terminal domain-related protein [Pseudomonas putida]|uniref:EF-Tu C-terminal domain-related protein n=1 Tax=Pseudomonas putida TaxID=303 RepID=UPI0027E3C6D4|nr:hypothetical protein [Pseudomonas putida]